MAKNMTENTQNTVANMIYTWREASPMTAKSFATLAEAQEYNKKKSELYAQWHMELSPVVYGTQEENEAAQEAFMKAVKAKELNDFKEHIAGKIKREEVKISMLDAVCPIIRKFDGKVLNKRFHEAIKSSTGYYSSFDGDNFKLYDYNYPGSYSERPEVIMYAQPHGWSWTTGDRLEADKALAIIETLKNQSSEKVAALKAQPAQYLEYKAQVEKVEKMIHELTEYPYELRDYCREELAYNCDVNYIWRH